MKKTSIFHIILFAFLLSNTLNCLGQWNAYNIGYNWDFISLLTTYTDTNTIYIAGNKGIIKSSDQGISWSKEVLIGEEQDSLLFERTSFKSIKIAGGFIYAVGSDTVNKIGVIFKKDSIWQKEFTTNETDCFNDIDYAGDKIGICAVGNKGKIVTNMNNNTVWYFKSNPYPRDLNKIYYFYDNSYNNYFYLGGEKILLKESEYAPYLEVINSESYVDFYVYFNKVWGINKNQILYKSGFGTVKEYKDYPIGTTFNCFRSLANGYHIGTNTGVCKFDSVCEFYPSTMSYQINDIFIFSKGLGYAIGNNGAFLKTANQGGKTRPYVNFSHHDGACINNTDTFSNKGLIKNMYTWKLNDSVVSNNYNFYHTFTDTGEYRIKLIGDNGTFKDSMVYNYKVVNIPKKTMTLFLVRNIVCFQDSTKVIIPHSEPDVTYSILDSSSKTLINTSIGNGDTISISTGMLEKNISLKVWAKNLYSECSIYFDTTLKVKVEKTSSDFYFSNINAGVNEPVSFYNKSKESSIYKWEFICSDTTIKSNQKNPKLSFSDAGSTKVKLISESANHCIDSVLKDGPFIYDSKELGASCWSFSNLAESPLDYKHNQILRVVYNEENNIFICGRYDHISLNSRTGLRSHKLNGTGGYLAKYDENGVLKWFIHNEDDGLHSFPSKIMDFCWVKDKIYLSGVCSSSKTNLVFNNNDTVTTIDNHNFISKVTEDGLQEWTINFKNAFGQFIGTDSKENIYVGGELYDIFPANFYSRSDSVYTKQLDGHNYFILKADSSGNIKWITDFGNYSGYYFNFNKMSVDSSGNIYCVGQFGNPTTFKSVSGLPINIKNRGNTDCYIAKYDSSGNALWVHSIGAIHSESLSTFDFGEDLELDSMGNCYILIHRIISGQGDKMIFPSVNQRVDSVDCGSILIASYTKNGDFRWATGTNVSYDALEAIDLSIYNKYLYLTGNTYCDTTRFISRDGRSQSLTPGSSQYSYIVKYDIYGNLLRIVDENKNPFYLTSYQEMSAKNGSLISSGIFRLNVKVAGDSLQSDNYFNVFMAKFSEDGCGIIDSIEILPFNHRICIMDSIDIHFAVDSNIALEPDNSFFLLSYSPNFKTVIDTIGVLNSNSYNSSFRCSFNKTGNYYLMTTASSPIMSSNPIVVYVDSLKTGFLYLDSICYESSVQIGALIGDSITWNTNKDLSDSTSYFPFVNPLVNRVYISTIYSLCGSSNDTFDITVMPPISISVPNDTTICPNDTVIMKIKSNYKTVVENPYNIKPYDDSTYFAYPNKSNYYIFRSSNEIGCNKKDTTIITVIKIPNIETEKYIDRVLIKASFKNYQWYMDSILLQDSTQYRMFPSKNGSYMARLTDNNGCSFYSIPYEFIKESGKLEVNNLISYYPNPADDNIYINNPNGKRIYIQILDMYGHILIERTINEEFLNIQSLASGVYLLNIDGKLFKLIKQ